LFLKQLQILHILGCNYSWCMDIDSYLIQMDPATHVVIKHIITVVSTLYSTYIILTNHVKF